MNKLVFDGNVIDLYAADYQFLQDSTEEEVKRFVRQLSVDGYNSAIIKGFVLGVSPTDATKLYVHHNGETGSVVLNSGTIVESSEVFDEIELANSSSGIVNIVYAQYVETKGSYIRATDTIVYTPAVIDLENYTLVYNRAYDTITINVCTQAAYSALTAEQLLQVVMLGKVTAQGPSVELVAGNIDLTANKNFQFFVSPGSVGVTELDPELALPQINVAISSIEDDAFYADPQNLEDNLNSIRTQIKNIKGTVIWDDAMLGVEASDINLNQTITPGVFTTYGNTFTTTTSTGQIIIVDTGKALVGSYLGKQTSIGVENVTAGESIQIGNYDSEDIGNSTNGEFYNMPGTLQDPGATITLLHYPVANLHIIDNTFPIEYTTPAMYTLDSSTGVVVFPLGLSGDGVNCYYSYGRPRKDLVLLTSTGIEVREGTSAVDPLYPIPANNETPLYYIEVPGVSEQLYDFHLNDARTYVQQRKEAREILSTAAGSYYGTYNTGEFRLERLWAIHRLVYIKKRGAYQGFGLSIPHEYNETNLADATTYSLRVSINGAGAVNHQFTTTSAVTIYQEVVDFLNIAFPGTLRAVFRNGDVEIETTDTTDTNTIAISAGAGNDLLAALNAIPLITTAVPASTARGLTTATGIGWSIATDATYGYKTTVDNTMIIRSIIYTKENDQLWMMVYPHKTETTIKIKYENVPGSNDLDLSASITIPASVTGATVDSHPVPILLKSGFSEIGYRRFEIYITSGTQLNFQKLMVSDLDIEYQAGGIYTKILSANDAKVRNTLTVNTLSVTGDLACSGNIQGGIPVGAVIPLLQGYFTDGSNGGYTSVGVALPAWMKLCNGALLNDAASPIWNTAGRYLPNISDSRFLMGHTTAGTAGGSNTLNHTHTIAAHGHAIGANAAGTISTIGNHSHTISGSTGNDTPDHTHNYPLGTATGAPGVAPNGWNDADNWNTVGASVRHTHPAGTLVNSDSGSHNHTISFSGRVGTDTAGDATITTNGQTGSENRPLYMSCVYVIRIK